MDNISESAIKRIENWINQLPRRKFDYRTPSELYAEEVRKIKECA